MSEHPGRRAERQAHVRRVVQPPRGGMHRARQGRPSAEQCACRTVNRQPRDCQPSHEQPAHRHHVVQPAQTKASGHHPVDHGAVVRQDVRVQRPPMRHEASRRGTAVGLVAATDRLVDVERHAEEEKRHEAGERPGYASGPQPRSSLARAKVERQPMASWCHTRACPAGRRIGARAGSSVPPSRPRAVAPACGACGGCRASRRGSRSARGRRR